MQFKDLFNYDSDEKYFKYIEEREKEREREREREEF